MNVDNVPRPFCIRERATDGEKEQVYDDCLFIFPIFFIFYTHKQIKNNTQE